MSILCHLLLSTLSYLLIYAVKCFRRVPVERRAIIGEFLCSIRLPPVRISHYTSGAHEFVFGFSGIRFARSSFLCNVDYWLSFCLFSIGRCIACLLIYWLLLWYIQTFLLILKNNLYMFTSFYVRRHV